MIETAIDKIIERMDDQTLMEMNDLEIDSERNFNRHNQKYNDGNKTDRFNVQSRDRNNVSNIDRREYDRRDIDKSEYDRRDYDRRYHVRRQNERRDNHRCDYGGNNIDRRGIDRSDYGRHYNDQRDNDRSGNGARYINRRDNDHKDNAYRHNGFGDTNYNGRSSDITYHFRDKSYDRRNNEGTRFRNPFDGHANRSKSRGDERKSVNNASVYNENETNERCQLCNQQGHIALDCEKFRKQVGNDDTEQDIDITYSLPMK